MFKTNASCQQSWLESLASFKCLGGRVGPEPVHSSDGRDRKGAQRAASSLRSPTPAKKKEKEKRKKKKEKEKKPKERRMTPAARFLHKNSTVRSKVEEKSASLSPCRSLAACVCACTQLNERGEGGGCTRKAPIQRLNLTRNSPKCAGNDSHTRTHTHARTHMCSCSQPGQTQASAAVHRARR